MRGRSQGRPSCISQVQMWKVCPLTVLGPHEINCLQRNIWFTASHCLEKPFWVQTSISLSPCLSSTSFLPTCYWQLTVFGPLVHPVYLQLPASVCLRFYSEGTENGEQAGKLTLLAFLMTVGSKRRSCRHLNDTADEQKGRLLRTDGQAHGICLLQWPHNLTFSAHPTLLAKALTVLGWLVILEHCLASPFTDHLTLSDNGISSGLIFTMDDSWDPVKCRC